MRDRIRADQSVRKRSSLQPGANLLRQTRKSAPALPGLFTEADYHYRFKATNANGMEPHVRQFVHTVAVLKAKTGAITNLASTSAT